MSWVYVALQYTFLVFLGGALGVYFAKRDPPLRVPTFYLKSICKNSTDRVKGMNHGKERKFKEALIKQVVSWISWSKVHRKCIFFIFLGYPGGWIFPSVTPLRVLPLNPLLTSKYFNIPVAEVTHSVWKVKRNIQIFHRSGVGRASLFNRKSRNPL